MIIELQSKLYCNVYLKYCFGEKPFLEFLLFYCVTLYQYGMCCDPCLYNCPQITSICSIKTAKLKIMQRTQYDSLWTSWFADAKQLNEFRMALPTLWVPNAGAVG